MLPFGLGVLGFGLSSKRRLLNTASASSGLRYLAEVFIPAVPGALSTLGECSHWLLASLRGAAEVLEADRARRTESMDE